MDGWMNEWMNEELVRLMVKNNVFDARNKRKPGSKEPNRLDEERNSGGIDSEGHNTYSQPPNRVFESMHPVEQLHFLSLIPLSRHALDSHSMTHRTSDAPRSTSSASPSPSTTRPASPAPPSRSPPSSSPARSRSSLADTP